MSYFLLAESVSDGHPDKVADQISDAVATYLIDKNPKNRVAIETMVTTNSVTLAGEYKSDVDMDHLRMIVANTIAKIGYEQEGFDCVHLVLRINYMVSPQISPSAPMTLVRVIKD